MKELTHKGRSWRGKPIDLTKGIDYDRTQTVRSTASKRQFENVTAGPMAKVLKLERELAK